MADILGNAELVQPSGQEPGREPRPEPDGKDQPTTYSSEDESDHVVYHLGDPPMDHHPSNVESMATSPVSVDFKGFNSKYVGSSILFSLILRL